MASAYMSGSQMVRKYSSKHQKRDIASSNLKGGGGGGGGGTTTVSNYRKNIIECLSDAAVYSKHSLESHHLCL